MGGGPAGGGGGGGGGACVRVMSRFVHWCSYILFTTSKLLGVKAACGCENGQYPAVFYASHR